MNRVGGKAFVIAGLILMLGGTSSWGAPPNNDASDAAGNHRGRDGRARQQHHGQLQHRQRVSHALCR
jgi:hypothetical protein